MFIGLGRGYGFSSFEGRTPLSFKIFEIRQQKGIQFLEAVHLVVFAKMWKM